MKLKKYFQIDPLKSFVELPILWVTVSVLFAIATIIAIIIAFNSNLELTLDYNGFNTFVEIFRVPLAILAITITFAAFLATAHRSVQTREQLIITNKQNTFSNYFKHIEEFEKYIATSIKGGPIHFKNIRATHKYLFPNAIKGDYSINEEFLTIVEIEYSEFKSLFDRFNYPEEKILFSVFHKIYAKIDKIFSLLNVSIERTGQRYIVGGDKIIVPDLKLNNAFLVVKNNTIILEQVLSFEHSVVIPKVMKQISRLDISDIPDLVLTTNDYIPLFEINYDV